MTLNFTYGLKDLADNVPRLIVNLADSETFIFNESCT